MSKTSTERLRLLLVKAGADIEVIGSVDRPTLLIIIIINNNNKNECHSNIIVDKLQGCR